MRWRDIHPPTCSVGIRYPIIRGDWCRRMRLGWQTVFVGYRSDDVIYWRRSMVILDSNFGVRLRDGFRVVEE